MSYGSEASHLWEHAAMDCWHCRRAASAACRFCGRGVCKEHAQNQAFVLEVFEGEIAPRALVVEDAIWCGACHPRPEPVDLPELG